MNRALVDKVVQAVLYEGYILYPYRQSVKNRQRWSFGGLYPRSWSDAPEGGDACTMQTQCLLKAGAGAELEIHARFLHLMDRRAGVLDKPLGEWMDEPNPPFRPVESFQAGGRTLRSWQEAVERDVDAGKIPLADLASGAVRKEFNFPSRRTLEPVRDEGGKIVAVLVRQQEQIQGALEISARPLAGAEEGVFEITVKVLNLTPLEEAAKASRDDALMRSFASTHAILTARGGEFLSMIDPPDAWKAAAGQCSNVGAWPVLVGDADEKDTMLASPIILYDYPQIAPESPGDLFDSTEIDEILTLRIMTLTDEEKRDVAATDVRGKALLERTESLARQSLMDLHGTMRGLRPSIETKQP